MGDEAPRSSDPPDDAQRQAMRAAAKRIDRVNRWLHLGGALPPDEYQRFQHAGITHLVDLREDDTADSMRLRTFGIIRRHVPVPNGGPPTVEQLAEVGEWIKGTDEGAIVYVHCQGGFGRAATMAVGLLVLYGARLDEAIEQVRKARPEMRLNEAQMAWPRTLKKEFSDDASE